MTEKHTLSIDQAEWRVLFASNIARVNDFINQNPTLDVEKLKAMLDHLDRAKLIARSWCASVPQAVPAETAQKLAEAPAVVANGNGAEKKKPGWPKGKPRKRLNPQQVVQ